MLLDVPNAETHKKGGGRNDQDLPIEICLALLAIYIGLPCIQLSSSEKGRCHTSRRGSSSQAGLNQAVEQSVYLYQELQLA